MASLVDSCLISSAERTLVHIQGRDDALVSVLLCQLRSENDITYYEIEPNADTTRP